MDSIPTFTIDLDLPPEKRWAEIAHAYKDYWGPIAEGMWASFDDVGGDDDEADSDRHDDNDNNRSGDSKHRQFAQLLAENILTGFEAAQHQDWAKELRSIAAISQVPLEDLILLNLSYEMTGCTSVVCFDAEGNTLLARTLDWLTEDDYLKPLTVNLNFMRDNRLLYSATSWAGYLGILTAMRPESYAVAINFRVDFTNEQSPADEKNGHNNDYNDDDNHNIFAYPVGYAVRAILEDPSVNSYRTALEAFSSIRLMSPTYIILAGLNAEGAILTRNTDSEEQRLVLSNNVSTNLNAWLKYNAAIEELERKDRQEAEETALPKDGASSSSSSNSGGIFGLLTKIPGLSSLFGGTSDRDDAEAGNVAMTVDDDDDNNNSNNNNDDGVRLERPKPPPAHRHRKLPVILQANLEHWIHQERFDLQESLCRSNLIRSALNKRLGISSSNNKSERKGQGKVSRKGKGKGKGKKAKGEPPSSSSSSSITVDDIDPSSAATAFHFEIDDLWQLLSTHPIWESPYTVYASIMSPSLGYFNSVLECDQVNNTEGKRTSNNISNRNNNNNHNNHNHNRNNNNVTNQKKNKKKKKKRRTGGG